MNDYVLKHDFGYGRAEDAVLNKLKLRNIDDLKDYIFDLIQVLFVADLQGDVICFSEDSTKVKITIREM